MGYLHVSFVAITSQMSLQDSHPLIQTKMRLPFTRPELVSRPRLQEQILQGLRGPLTLITAPGGFGKTTLVAHSLSGCGMPIAWMSLDRDDNRTGRFLDYLVAAVQQADPALGRRAAQMTASSPPAPPEAILTSLINDLDDAGRDIVVVLDDYQLISSQAVHEQVDFLLSHCPVPLHLLIASRSDPPLHLSRLRARAQMVELRAADLRFTLPEVTEFLNVVMDLGLDAGAVAVLEGRTEGWIAGLQMAALSMRSHADVPGFIEGFSGTQRYILDYLLEEILTVQPQEVQDFLLRTAILDRLSAPLCDELLAGGEPGSAPDPGLATSAPLERSPSQAMLDYLERANLFLVPLDEDRAWYRYHHLFADLLRARLEQLHPGLSLRLHARAAAWLERADMTVDAVNHRLAAGEFDCAARLVEENTTRLLAGGELNALMAWIEILPAELRRTRPWLCVHQAYALMFAGRSGDVWPLLAQAETAMMEASPSSLSESSSGQAAAPAAPYDGRAEIRALNGAVAAARAFAAAVMVQDTEALSQAQRASELLEPGDLFDQALVAWARGYALHSRGRLPEARAAFEEQVRLARAMHNDAALMIGVTALARVLGDQGLLRESRALLERALAEAGGKEARNQGFIARLKAHLAGVLLEQNELVSAHRLLSDALADARFWLNPNHMAFILNFLARVLLAEGDPAGAHDTIRELDRLRETAQLSYWLRCSLEAAIVRGCLALQSTPAGLLPEDPLAQQSRLIQAAWQRQMADRTGGPHAALDQCMETAVLAMGRVSLSSGNPGRALDLLDPVTHSSISAGHFGTAIGALVLSAVACQASPSRGGVSHQALGRLEEALALAEPGGYVRVFIDEGRPMRLLLAQWVAQAQPGSLHEYAGRLLAAFDGPPLAPVHAYEAGPASSGLIDPLSLREVEVLQLVALGCTNQEIADQLIVAPGTVKAHTASIYRKLEVANRTQAVARARQLGLLP